MSTTKFAHRKTMEGTYFADLGHIVKTAIRFALDHQIHRPDTVSAKVVEEFRAAVAAALTEEFCELQDQTAKEELGNE
jgi:hypothetical protein